MAAPDLEEHLAGLPSPASNMPAQSSAYCTKPWAHRRSELIHFSAVRARMRAHHGV